MGILTSWNLLGHSRPVTGQLYLYLLPFNSLNAELNPICHLLELVGAHPILHVSRIRVNLVPDHGSLIALEACVLL